MRFYLVTFNRGELEWFRKPRCSPCPIKNTRAKPGTSDNESGLCEIDPKIQTNQESKDRRDQLMQPAITSAHIIMNDGGQVDTHETKQCSEVEEFCASIIPF